MVCLELLVLPFLAIFTAPLLFRAPHPHPHPHPHLYLPLCLHLHLVFRLLWSPRKSHAALRAMATTMKIADRAGVKSAAFSQCTNDVRSAKTASMCTVADDYTRHTICFCRFFCPRMRSAIGQHQPTQFYM